uniref:Uncharacterized protein n=1 Tax=Tetranychus urticae TaxID=32264 RepID=T1L5E3_TETUR
MSKVNQIKYGIVLGTKPIQSHDITSGKAYLCSAEIIVIRVYGYSFEDVDGSLTIDPSLVVLDDDLKDEAKNNVAKDVCQSFRPFNRASIKLLKSLTPSICLVGNGVLVTDSFTVFILDLIRVRKAADIV